MACQPPFSSIEIAVPARDGANSLVVIQAVRWLLHKQSERRRQPEQAPHGEVPHADIETRHHSAEAMVLTPLARARRRRLGRAGIRVCVPSDVTGPDQRRGTGAADDRHAFDPVFDP